MNTTTPQPLGRPQNSPSSTTSVTKSLTRIDELFLVYDADTGSWNALVDSTRKLLQVGGCALCAITHGLREEKQEWRDCREELGVPIEQLHRDEIPAPLAALTRGQLPCVVARVGGDYQILLDATVLARCKGSVGDFRGRLLTHAAMLDLEL